jgi:hypothetical protein
MIFRYFISFLILVGVFGCVDEPFIEHAPIPYSVVKLGNFADNVNIIEVTVTNADGELKSYTINKGEITEFITLTSGKRTFLVKNVETSETIYSAQVTISSYEEVMLFFSGYSKPGDDINNSFSPLYYTNGVVYLYEDHETNGKVLLRLYNLISDTPESASTDFLTDCYDVAGDSLVVSTSTAIGFNESTPLFVPGKTCKFVVYHEGDPDNSIPNDTLKVFNLENLESGYDHYLFLTGPVTDPGYTLYKSTPLAESSK